MIKMRLVRLLSHAKKYIIYQVLWQWVALLAQVLSIFFVTDLIQKALYDTWTKADFQRTIAVLLGTMVVRYFCDRRASYAGYQASVDVKRILRENIYEKLLRLGSSYREQIATSEVVQMSAEGVEQLEVYFGRYLSQLFYSLLAPLTLFVILSVKVSVKASVVLLVCVPLIPLSIVAVQKIAKKLLKNYWGIYTGLGDSFLENLQGLTTLKIYQADEMKAKEMDKESERFRKITMKVLTMQLNSTSVMDIMAYGGAAVGILVALKQFQSGVMDVAGVLTMILLAVEFFLPLRILGSYFHIAMNGMAASDKIFDFLDLPEPEQGKEVLEAPVGDIRLKEVTFSYDGEREILHQVQMQIPAQGFVSIVGESGCGKSTIAGLLVGRNKNYSGEILLGGRQLSDIREESLLQHVTLVAHNSYLFQGTVEENLRMANPNATEEELILALKKCNLWEFLKKRDGLETRLTERGANFSGGQCQRLALARALLHDSEVYIFDEATSNIDAESEDIIMGVIREMAKHRTVLLISHRLSNVVLSDCIYMMKEGAVTEQGTHQQLMERKGEYYRLYESQRRLEEYAGE